MRRAIASAKEVAAARREAATAAVTAKARGITNRDDAVLVTDLDQAAARQVARELGEPATALALDVRDDAAVRAARDRIIAVAGRLDVWVNNAAVGVMGLFWEIPLADHARLVDVDLKGMMTGAHVALRRFVADGVNWVSLQILDAPRTSYLIEAALPGHTHDEIVEYREEWQARAARFGSVSGWRDDQYLPAPPLPTTRLKPRRRNPQ